MLHAFQVLLGMFAELPKVTSFAMSACLSLSIWNNLASTKQIFIELEILEFLENMTRKLKFN
jgi:hypothetical protein